MTDREALLAAVDEQLRRRAPLDAISEDDGNVIRCIYEGGWNAVVWSDLDETTADAAIARQIARFAELRLAWEWKHYSHDAPPDLARRLQAAGLTREPDETLMVAEIAELAVPAQPRPGVEVEVVTDARGVDELIRIHNEVFGSDHAGLRKMLLGEIESGRGLQTGVIARVDGQPAAAARVEFEFGTAFAGLWGGGTLPEFRRRGAFGAMVARRAGMAAERGFRYLRVDASDESRPILERLGFVALATTTPFTMPAPS